jgi:hypothetical protein
VTSCENDFPQWGHLSSTSWVTSKTSTIPFAPLSYLRTYHRISPDICSFYSQATGTIFRVLKVFERNLRGMSSESNTADSYLLADS